MNISALKMASAGNRHCADCVGTLSFHLYSAENQLDGKSVTECFPPGTHAQTDGRTGRKRNAYDSQHDGRLVHKKSPCAVISR